MTATITKLTDEQIHEFFQRLDGPEGCNFQGEGDDQTWTCDSSTDRPLARAILTKMGLDENGIAGLLADFNLKGGYCDCEILFNAARHWDPPTYELTWRNKWATAGAKSADEMIGWLGEHAARLTEMRDAGLEFDFDCAADDFIFIRTTDPALAERFGLQAVDYDADAPAEEIERAPQPAHFHHIRSPGAAARPAHDPFRD